MSAGGLALGMAELCELCGEWEEVFIVLSIFFIGMILSFNNNRDTVRDWHMSSSYSPFFSSIVLPFSPWDKTHFCIFLVDRILCNISETLPDDEAL